MKTNELNEQRVTIENMNANTIIELLVEISELNRTGELDFRRDEFSLSLYDDQLNFVGGITYTISEDSIHFDLHSTFLKTKQIVHNVFKWAIECYDLFIKKIDQLLCNHELLYKKVDLSKYHIKILFESRFSDLRFIFYESEKNNRKELVVVG